MAPKLKDFRRLLQLHATLSSPTANANEAAIARKKTSEWLVKFGFAAKDYIAVLTSAEEAVRKDEEAKAAAAAPPPPPPGSYDATPLDESERFPLFAHGCDRPVRVGHDGAVSIHSFMDFAHLHF